MKVLIVCPKSIRGTWMKEFRKHMPPEYDYWIKLCRSHLRLLEDMMEGIQADHKLKVWLIPVDRLKSNIEPLVKMGFDMTIVDESSRIKSPSAKRSKAAREIGEASDRRCIMTGTPVGNNVLDLWSQFQFLQPGCLGYDSFSGFKQRYAKIRKVDNWEKIEGFQHIDELKERMGLHTQYLMMEATRLSDEARSRPASDETEGTHETGEPPTREMKRPALPDPVPEKPPATAATPSPAERPVVVIDSDLDALEWTKQTLSQVFLRVHVFQHPDHALSRIRQYLAGGALPLVLVSCGDGRGDSSKGIGNPRAFVGRLKAQASRTLVVWLATAGAPAPRSVSPADGVVTRPASSQLADPNATAHNQPLAEQLRTDLLECVAQNCAAEGVDR